LFLGGRKTQTDVMQRGGLTAEAGSGKMAGYRGCYNAGVKVGLYRVS
jgi:hypothetical protein